jgi:hypothetical protein
MAAVSTAATVKPFNLFIPSPIPCNRSYHISRHGLTSDIHVT